MSEEKTRQVLMSVNPHQGDPAMSIYPALDNGPGITGPSIIGQPFKLSETGDSLNIQPQMNAALSVAGKILNSPAAVRQVTVKPGEVTKTGRFRKKKASEPSLVFTVSGNESHDDD